MGGSFHGGFSLNILKFLMPILGGLELSSLQLWCWMSTFCGKFKVCSNTILTNIRLFSAAEFFSAMFFSRCLWMKSFQTSPNASIVNGTNSSGLFQEEWFEFWFLIWVLVSDLIRGRENGDGRSDVNWTIKSEPLPVISDRASRSTKMGGSQANALSFVTKINLC